MEFFTKIVDGPYPWTIFTKRSTFDFDSDLKHSNKEYIYLTIVILHMIYCIVKAICKWFKEKEAFYFEIGRRFPDEIVSFLLFLYSK